MCYEVLLAMVLLAGVPNVEDPLESLNTVEDTIVTMQHTLHARSPVPAPDAAQAPEDTLPASAQTREHSRSGWDETGAAAPGKASHTDRNEIGR